MSIRKVGNVNVNFLQRFPWFLCVPAQNMPCALVQQLTDVSPPTLPFNPKSRWTHRLGLSSPVRSPPDRGERAQHSVSQWRGPLTRQRPDGWQLSSKSAFCRRGQRQLEKKSRLCGFSPLLLLPELQYLTRMLFLTPECYLVLCVYCIIFHKAPK